MEQSRRTTVIREWIIFALCVGLGGHVVLGLILHAPEHWPWSHAGGYGILVGLFLYVVVQGLRSLMWVLRGRGKREQEEPGW